MGLSVQSSNNKAFLRYSEWAYRLSRKICEYIRGENIIRRLWRFLSSVRICALARIFTQFSQKETAHARCPSFFSARTQKQNAEHHRRVRNQGGCWRTCILLYTYIYYVPKIYIYIRLSVGGGRCVADNPARANVLPPREPHATQRENNKQWLEFSQYIGCCGSEHARGSQSIFHIISHADFDKRQQLTRKHRFFWLWKITVLTIPCRANFLAAISLASVKFVTKIQRNETKPVVFCGNTQRYIIVLYKNQWVCDTRGAFEKCYIERMRAN